MSSISKSEKLHEEQNAEQCEDRISHLPSSLISHILSLLPTKYAVATSVLSTQWKQFWTLITSLDFDDELSLHVESTNTSIQTSFTNFVYRVLLLRRVSCLHRFRLKCQSYCISHVNAWVAASLMRGVQELDLSLSIGEWVENFTCHVLPRDLFACRTISVLKLGMGAVWFVMNVPTSVRMQSLKILHLHHVEFIDDDSIYRLICGCPVLDELSMGACAGKDVQVNNIFAPVLTKLVIKPLAYYYESETEVSTHEIVLDTPALLYLELNNEVSQIKGFLFENLTHLIKANIIFRYPPGVQSHEVVSKALTDFLMGISSVRCLFLDLFLNRELIVALQRCHYQLPMFHNLASLKMYWDFVDGWDFMFQLLEKSPHLATLVLVEGLESYCNYWEPPQNVPECLVSHLKVIEIVILEGNEGEMKRLKYFLKNAEVLETMKIHVVSVDLKEEVEIMKKILKLPKSSKFCQIECV